ncbi:MAG: alanine--tRNA ligase-related protein [Enterobacter hormaechei]
MLRRIIRRAIRHGNMLGARGHFFYKLVGPLIGVMGWPVTAETPAGAVNRF